MASNNTPNASTSKTITFVSGFTCISAVILVALTGVLVGASIAETSGWLSVLCMLLGAFIGAFLGLIISLPICALLDGFAKIVAWYEAVPPGQVCIIQSPDDNSAHAQPPSTEGHDRSAVPVGHADKGPELRFNPDDARQWKCRCGTMNSSLRTTCTACGRTLPEPVKPADVPKSSPKKRVPQATWVCTCGAENPVSHGSCDSCGAVKPKR